MTKKITNLNWRQRVAYLALHTLLLVLRAFSVRQCARFGTFLGDQAFRRMANRRRTVVHNLRIVFAGKKSYEECEAAGREVFRRTGGNIVGGLRGGLLSDDGLKEVIEVRGQENMRAALAEGRGVITLIGHMGPWEILAQIGQMLFLGARFGSLYRPIDNPAVDALVRKEREKRGARLFSRKDGWAGPIGLLREGGALAVLADQRVGAAGVAAPFFGREVLTSRLPYILHRKSGAPLITMSAWTVEPGKWRVQIHPPIFPQREGMNTRETFTRRCNEALEAAFKVSQEDVFWFHRRFRPESQTFFPGAGAGEDGSAGPVRRTLVVLPDGQAAAVACARAIAAFSRARPRLAFVIAGNHAGMATTEAGLAGATDLIDAKEGTPPAELVRRIQEVERTGAVGIDGAVIFSNHYFLFWCGVSADVGLDRILGPTGETAPRKVGQPFALPTQPNDAESWLAILEGLSACQATEMQAQ